MLFFQCFLFSKNELLGPLYPQEIQELVLFKYQQVGFLNLHFHLYKTNFKLLNGRRRRKIHEEGTRNCKNNEKNMSMRQRDPMCPHGYHHAG